MELSSLLRAARHVRHLLPEQAVAQLLHVLYGRVEPVRLPGEAPSLRVSQAFRSFPAAPSHTRGDGRRLELINREVEFGERIDWDYTAEGLLWSFHLHQFDWLRQPDLSAALRTSQLLDWVERHPRGIGWRPHPISLRILSWGKLLLTPGALELDADASERIRYSLACQVETLARNPERRLQGNHLFSNWLAVVFAGLLFEGPRADAWLDRVVSFRRQLDRQIGPDGSHLERSPMYHSLLLENVLDLLNLARATSAHASIGSTASALADDLERCASRMLGALEVWTHPDGDIALFADSAHGIAHPLLSLRAYADSLGVKVARPQRPGFLQDSGFARLEVGPFVLLASVAGPMPAHQPGHAHCDALAFELSLAGRRVVTDTGVGGYTPGPERELTRATRSHATIEVAGRDQAEIFAAHRIGGRPKVTVHRADPPAFLDASCVGWGSGGVRHRRTFELSAACLTIRDTLEGGPQRVRIAFPLAPGLEPELPAQAGESDVVALIPLPGGGRLELVAESVGEPVSEPASNPAGRGAEGAGRPRWSVERAPYFPEFGKRLERSVLVGVADAFRAGIWHFRLR